MSPDQVLKELEASGLRGRGGAGFSMGKKASFLPHGEVEKYLCCNADESEPGHLQGPRADAQEPAPADRGHHDRRLRGRHAHAFIYIRGEYEEEADILDAAVSEAYARGYVGERHPALGLLVQPRRAPRRRRLHLRRGDRAARLARGQARQPAAEAALPGQPGPLPGTDADQQRRDALERRRT